jgi:hypothetical protein
LPNGIKSWPDPVSDGWWQLVAAGGIWWRVQRRGALWFVRLERSSVAGVAEPGGGAERFSERFLRRGAVVEEATVLSV